MMYRGFLGWFLICLALSSWAEEFEDAADITASTQAFLEASLADQYPGVRAENIKVSVSRVDPRLRLPRCNDEIEQSITTPKPYRSNVSVKVQCTGSRPWTIYVPAKVDTYAQVATLSKSMARGEIITGNDIELTLMDTAQAGYGYISDPARLVGMELKRRLQVGSAIRLSHVKAAEVVSKGDKVALEATTGGVTVVTGAEALASGELGQQIRVRNSKSSREVDAVVIAPGRVKVTL